MNRWRGLWKTIRPINLLIMVFTMCGVYVAIITQLDGLKSNHLLFGLLTLAIVLLGAGGNVINDIEDVEVDAINKPDENQIGTTISKHWAMKWYFILTLSGILAGLVVSTLLKDLLLFSVILFIALSLWFYSRWMQKQMLIGNLVVAVLCAILPFLPLLLLKPSIIASFSGISQTGIEQNYFAQLRVNAIVQFYVLFAFMTTMIREMVKDLDDIEGDRSAGYKTLSICLNPRLFKAIVIGLLFSLFLLLFLQNPERSLFIGLNEPTPLYSFLILIYLPLALTTLFAFNMKSGPSIKLVSKWLKISMVIGISSTAFFWFL